MVECVKSSRGGAFGRSLVDCALDALRKLAALPGKKTLARVIETPHPYENNMVRYRLSHKEEEMAVAICRDLE